MVDAQKLLENCQGKLIVVEQENANLKTALGTARRIGAALGILMATRKITDDQAFAVLSGISQATNRKIPRHRRGRHPDRAPGLTTTPTLGSHSRRRVAAT